MLNQIIISFASRKLYKDQYGGTGLVRSTEFASGTNEDPLYIYETPEVTESVCSTENSNAHYNSKTTN